MNLDFSSKNISFLKVHIIGFVLSSILIVGSIISFLSFGLNFGIDFKGGTLIEIETKEDIDISQIRNALNNLSLGDIQIQEFGSKNDILIRIEQQSGGDKIQQNVVEIVKSKLDNDLDSAVNYRRTEVVGPKVSGELIQAGTLAITLAVFAMLLYIWFRFEWQFSLGAVLALIHDVILTIGIFCITQLEFNLPIIAAILTIVGYSMNDTVVVYDRVRENLRKHRSLIIEKLLDLSINETLSRTIITSITTLLALLSLYIFGGSVIKGFTFAMIWESLWEHTHQFLLPRPCSNI